ncbi:hypothetical protein COCNU_10G009450 [Cocos nucifera]|uniref:Uncharacterized protein n=1 Tax=Cocos nucifera TaxID=13894 RepID=A0A8K0N8S9_COCNU|nr:hypothetical protein COCNU_10G009450 [Cocos nucifera]
MAASCFTRFSLPPYIPSSLKRAVPLLATLPSSPLQFRFPNVLVSATNRRPTFLRYSNKSVCLYIFFLCFLVVAEFVDRVRSMSTDGSPEAVEVPRSVPVNVAHELLRAGHRYLDVSGFVGRLRSSKLGIRWELLTSLTCSSLDQG